MLKLNLLTALKGDNAYKPLDVTEEDFWQYYLRLLNARKKVIDLTDREIRILSYILAGDPNKSYFRSKEGKEIKRLFRLNRSGLSKMRSALIMKGYIQDTGGVRGDALPIRPIREFQKFVKEGLKKGTLPSINFMFTFDIENDTEKVRQNRRTEASANTSFNRGLHTINDRIEI